MLAVAASWCCSTAKCRVGLISYAILSIGNRDALRSMRTATPGPPSRAVSAAGSERDGALMWLPNHEL